MATAYLQGPDLVEISFNTDVRQIDDLGTTITGKTILGVSYLDNTVSYLIHPPVEAGDPDLAYSYSGTGNLVSLPTYQDIPAFDATVLNNVELEYITTLDGYVMGSPVDDDYNIVNDKLSPISYLGGLDDYLITTLDNSPIVIGTDIDNWLGWNTLDELLVSEDDPLVVDPTA